MSGTRKKSRQSPLAVHSVKAYIQVNTAIPKCFLQRFYHLLCARCGIVQKVSGTRKNPTDRNASKIPGDHIKQYFAPSSFFEQGAETVDYKGYSIRMYSKERMLIELLRYKNKLPFDYYKEVLRGFRQILPQLDMQAIQDYAYEAPRSGKIMETLQTEVL